MTSHISGRFIVYRLDAAEMQITRHSEFMTLTVSRDVGINLADSLLGSDLEDEVTALHKLADLCEDAATELEQRVREQAAEAPPEEVHHEPAGEAPPDGTPACTCTDPDCTDPVHQEPEDEALS